MALRRIITASVTRGDYYYVAECAELPIVTQGKTVDETIDNLKEAVGLHLEGEDLEALGLTADPVVLITMEIEPAVA